MHEEAVKVGLKQVGVDGFGVLANGPEPIHTPICSF